MPWTTCNNQDLKVRSRPPSESPECGLIVVTLQQPAYEAKPVAYSVEQTAGSLNLAAHVCCTAQHSTAQHSTAQHSTAQHSTAWDSTAQHSMGQRSAAQDSTGQHSTAQHSTAQHSTAGTFLYRRQPLPSSSNQHGVHKIRCCAEARIAAAAYSKDGIWLLLQLALLCHTLRHQISQKAAKTRLTSAREAGQQWAAT